ncbi:hypothetical protein P3532_24460 [Vibrio parahaemolyticus]|uniref:hypothetical protein n=1 Tax=Vibrio parahaemolyticus TaxID=670 RepID=UPI001A8F7D51|nr:hypothetical protein [Vibrio parahaemolyticus]MBY8066578.1 hypothetical protein [Vibrio fluvialis]EJB8544122.1 hypothetical protein [Vibrio parahaemolyticus]MBO0190982.1 hypothetical protein [Vibrio parahaemolyticus]MBO0222478.1 hypothetical protein [Vibrio parahaemolyticus]MDF4792104.1 hypothetical protein [Vibrio parahaemolyticus]
MLNIKQAQASSAIQQAFAGNKSAVQVRRPKKDEYLFLGEETLDLMVITEKTMQMGQMYATENHYLVLGEEAQKALFNDLKTKTFVPAVNQYGEVFIAIFNAPSPNGFTCGYYETIQRYISELQKGYGRLVNDQANQCYRLEESDLPPFEGEFPSLEEVLSKEYENATVKYGNEEVLVRLGKTFSSTSAPKEETPATPPTQSTPSTPTAQVDGVDDDIDELDSIDPLEELLG